MSSHVKDDHHLSTGEFDPVKKMMKMTTFKQFIYKDTAIGNAASIGANMRRAVAPTGWRQTAQAAA